MDIDKKISKANKELKTSFSKVTIVRRNKKLYLRGTLPPKLGQEIKGLHRQDIALGLNATLENLPKAKEKAIAINHLLENGKFSWHLFSNQKFKEPKTSEKKESIIDLVERFSQDYLKRGLADGRRPYAVKEKWAYYFGILAAFGLQGKCI